MAKSRILLIGALCVGVIVLLALAVSGWIQPEGKQPTASDGSGQNTEASPLEIGEVKFEPIGAGKNVVHVEVHNRSADKQAFILHAYTLSGRAGWGRDYWEIIEAGQTRRMRFAFMIREAIGEGDYIRLRFFNPSLADGPDYSEWLGSHFEEWFKNVKYGCDGLAKRPADTEPLTAAAESDRDAALKIFESFQSLMGAGDYGPAWKLCTQDYLMAQQIDIFFTHPTLADKLGADYFIPWNPDELTAVRPETVWSKGKGLRLKGKSGNGTWTIDFVREGDDWKMDWFYGYGPKLNPLERALTRMKKHGSKHYDIYYFPNTTAAQDIQQIAEVRDKGVETICAFLGKEAGVRMRLVLFEDAQTKYRETRHQGAGFARGNTIGEIYSATEKMDPYHEAVHILMGAYGSPPAWLNEGFAVYMVERLGSKAMRGYGGGESTIREYARELKGRGEWIEPTELLALREIGPEGTRPLIAYPEAASLVQFFIETYGKDSFFKAYGTLKNSSDKAIQNENLKSLETICGKSLDVLNAEWEKFLSAAAIGS